MDEYKRQGVRRRRQIGHRSDRGPSVEAALFHETADSPGDIGFPRLDTFRADNDGCSGAGQLYPSAHGRSEARLGDSNCCAFQSQDSVLGEDSRAIHLDSPFDDKQDGRKGRGSKNREGIVALPFQSAEGCNGRDAVVAERHWDTLLTGLRRATTLPRNRGVISLLLSVLWLLATAPLSAAQGSCSIAQATLTGLSGSTVELQMTSSMPYTSGPSCNYTRTVAGTTTVYNNFSSTLESSVVAIDLGADGICGQLTVDTCSTIDQQTDSVLGLSKFCPAAAGYGCDEGVDNNQGCSINGRFSYLQQPGFGILSRYYYAIVQNLRRNQANGGGFTLSYSVTLCTPSRTVTPTGTPSKSSSRSGSRTPSITPSLSRTASTTSSQTGTPTITNSGTQTPSGTISPTGSPARPTCLPVNTWLSGLTSSATLALNGTLSLGTAPYAFAPNATSCGIGTTVPWTPANPTKVFGIDLGPSPMCGNITFDACNSTVANTAMLVTRGCPNATNYMCAYNNNDNPLCGATSQKSAITTNAETAWQLHRFYYVILQGVGGSSQNVVLSYSVSPRTCSVTPSMTASPTASPTSTISPTQTRSSTGSDSPTATGTPSSSATATGTGLPSNTLTASNTATITKTRTPTTSSSSTNTQTPSITSSQSSSSTVTSTPTSSATSIIPCDVRLGRRLVANLTGAGGSTGRFNVIEGNTSLLGFDPPSTCDDFNYPGGFSWFRTDWRADVIQLTIPSNLLLGGVLTVSGCGALSSSNYSRLAVGYGCPISFFDSANRFSCPDTGYNLTSW